MDVARKLDVSHLVEKRFLKTFEVKGELHYKTFFAPRRGRGVPLNVGDALSDRVE